MKCGALLFSRDVISPAVTSFVRCDKEMTCVRDDVFGRLADVTLDVAGTPFAQVSELNRIRREAVEQFQELQSRVPVIAIHALPNGRASTDGLQE